MASFTIEKRTRANGDSSYRCKIVVKKNNKIIHRESKTFRKKEINELDDRPQKNLKNLERV